MAAVSNSVGMEFEASQELATPADTQPVENVQALVATTDNPVPTEALMALTRALGEAFETNKKLAVVGSVSSLEANKKLAVSISAAYEAHVRLVITLSNLRIESTQPLSASAGVGQIESNKAPHKTVTAWFESSLGTVKSLAPVQYETLDPQPNPAFGISFAFTDGAHQMAQTWVAV